MISPDHQAILSSFFEKLRGGISAQIFNQIEDAIRTQWDLETLVSTLNLINHSAPEARFVHLSHLYTDLGLHNLLVSAEVEEDQRLEMLNRIAETEAVHKRTRPEEG